MYIGNVSLRQILDFEEFRTKVHDELYKPLDPKNQKDSREKTGLSKIKREPAYDFVGYGDAVFGNQSKIDVPGYNNKEDREYNLDKQGIPSIIEAPNSLTTNESFNMKNIKGIDYFL